MTDKRSNKIEDSSNTPGADAADSEELSPILAFAMDTARKAGAVLRDFYSRSLIVRTKSNVRDLVTDADLQSEALIVAAIHRDYPDHAIIAEEQGMIGDSACVWLVDPLDGTTNFAHRHPVFSVTIALVVNGQLRVGVVYDPLRDEIFAASAGSGARLNESRITVSAGKPLDQSLLATGFPYDRATNRDNNLREFSMLMPAVQGIRRCGSAALDMAYVACGRVDGYWELSLQPWDIAAGVLLVEEAGGRVTDLHNAPWTPVTRTAIAANPRLHTNIYERIGRPATA